MKKYLKSIAVAISLSLALFSNAQTHPEYGFYFNFNKGTKLSFATETGTGDISTWDLVVVAEKENTLTYSMLVKANEKIVMTNSVLVYHNDTILMPFNLNNHFTAAEFKHGRILYVSYPLRPQVGQQFPDIKEEYDLYSGSYKLHKKAFWIDRKVVDKETVKTPAGVFDCYVMAYKDGDDNNVKEWICEQVGRIKTETRNKKGQLAGKTQLISIGKI